MSDNMFLLVMVGVIVVIFSFAVPSLIRKRCPSCGTKNGLDASKCVKCGHEFPSE